MPENFLVDLETKRPSFTQFTVSEIEEKFYQDYISKKYKWKFTYREKNLQKHVDMMKSQGFEEYSRCENIEGTAFVFFKQKVNHEIQTV